MFCAIVLGGVDGCVRDTFFDGLSVAIVPSVFLLAAHLLAMQVAGAGPLVAVVLDLSGVRHSLLERLTRISWWAFWVGIVLGGAVALTQVTLVDRDYAPALNALSYKLKWGVLELIVFAVSLWAYWWGWRRLRSTRTRRGWHMFLGVFTATNLLYHFPSLMLLFSRVVAGRVTVEEPITAAVYRKFAFRGDVFAATTHFWLASCVTAGVALAWLAISHDDEPADDKAPVDSEPHVASDATPRKVGLWATAIALFAAMLQLPVGMWLLAMLSSNDQARMLGQDIWATCLLAGAFLVALSLMQELASVVFGAWNVTAVRRCWVKLCVVMVAMVGASMRLGQ